MKKIDPLELFFWTFRRNEKDVINLYDSLSNVMRLATGADALNFGYWNDDTLTPETAQEKLSLLFGERARLEPNLYILDVGSGFSEPAINWYEKFGPMNISCLNINYKQLVDSKHSISSVIKPDLFHLVNATATKLPFENNSFDRVLAFESAQHFKPLSDFILETKRIIKNDGILALAIPVMTQKYSPFLKLGLLSMTWSSEHYSANFVKSSLEKHFEIIDEQQIGSFVYEPLADYYIENRDIIKQKILQQYPPYVENILHKSIKKMKQVSTEKIIDYLILVCKKH